MLVYKITNKINGKCYIGQTKESVQKRWGRHCRPNACRVLFRAIKKYGKDNFDIKMLVKCNSIEEMNHREAYYIKLFNTLSPNGYNLTSGGFNYIRSVENKNSISKALIGHVISKETKYKISNSHKGKRLSEETKGKISKSISGKNAPWFGKKLPDAMKEKISAGQSTKKMIICNETNKIYPSIRSASRELNLDSGTITKVLKKNGKNKTVKGLTFSFYGVQNV